MTSTPPSGRLRVGVLQMTACADLLANVSELVKQLDLVEQEVDLITTPENVLFVRVDGEPIPLIKLEDSVFDRLSKWCVERNTYLHLGSVPILESQRMSNASVLLAPDGSRRVVYRKIHLFDVDVVGHKPMRESDQFEAGSRAAVIDINGWKIGLSICYDLRFAELFALYARTPVDMILVPSTFIVPTGRSHWMTLLRARAIESQCYVVAAAQSGQHKNHGAVRHSYGHSLIIDPWGEILEQAPIEKSGFFWLFEDLEQNRIKEVRNQIPMSKHRKIEVNMRPVLS